MSAPLTSLAVAPSLPVSIGLTIGWLLMPAGGFGLLNGLPRYRAVPPLKTQSQPLPSLRAAYAPSRSAHRLPVSVNVQTCDWSRLVQAASRPGSPDDRPVIGYGRARDAGPPNRSGPNSPYGPSPAIGRTFVAGSTRPGGRSAMLFCWASSVATIWSAATQAAALVIAGASIVTPQGTTSLPAAARASTSSTLTTALRFVSPVTTASGNSATAVAGALGWTLGEG